LLFRARERLYERETASRREKQLMPDPSSEINPLDQLAEEFVERYRRGERPALSEYISRRPELADQIRDLFPGLVLMEGIRPEAGEATGAFAGTVITSGAERPQRLGDYRILREVGRGGMGIVYEAEQESLGRHVALKVLPASALLDPLHLQRFEREAKAAAKLHHTNIVPVYGVGSDAGLHYYVMQFIQGLGLDEVLAELKRQRRGGQVPAAPANDTPGGSGGSSARVVSAVDVAQAMLKGDFSTRKDEGGRMKDEPEPASSSVHPSSFIPHPSSSSVHLPGSSGQSRLSETGRQYWHSVARVGIQVAEALAYAHGQGILHRDIKPSNLLLDTGGTVWVTDFGLAKAEGSEDLTRTGDIVGTVRYLAPERFQGQADARSDLYALGLTLYELLTFRSAFDETDRNKLVAQVMHAELRPPRQISPDVPRDLETIVLKALERESEHRYQKATELAEDLKRFVNNEPIRARRVSAWRRAVLWARRRPAAAGLLAVSALAVVALGVLVTGFVYNTQLKGALQETEEAKEKAEIATKEAERNKYFLHIAQAHAGWREGNLVGVEKLLDECPSDQRNWEWHYLKRLCHAHSMVFLGKDPMFGLAFSPDGQRLACGGLDRIVRVLDAATWKEIRSFHGSTSLIADVAFSPDGKRLAASCFDGSIKVWEVATSRELCTCKAHKDVVWYVAFSPDGKRLASASKDQTARLWDARTGQELRPALDHPGEVWGIAFSPDGSQIATGGSDKPVRLWEVATGRLVRTFERSAVGSYSPVAFSPDGRRLASADGDGNLTVWDAATGLREKRFAGHRGFVWCVTFSPDGQWLASSGIDQTVRVWDLASGQQRHALKGHTSEVCRVAFHPDGSWLASASSDGSVRAWPATADQEAQVFRSRGVIVGSLAYNPPDGAQLASTARDQKVTIWDAGTGQVTHTLPYPLLGPPSTDDLLDQRAVVSYSPDGSHIAAGAPDGSVPVWDTLTRELLQQPRLHPSGVWAVTYSPDGSRLATGGNDATVLVWEAATGRVLHKLSGHTKPVSYLAFSRDGGLLASASMDNTVMIWDATTGKYLHTLRGHDTWIMGVAFNRDGTRLASASNDNSVIIWEHTFGQGLLGQNVRARKLNHASMVWLAIFSPDSNRLATCSDDGAIKVWEVATGLETLTLRGHTTRITCLSFSPDGTRLASAGCADETMRIWDARPWTQESVLEAEVEREALGRLDFLFTKPLRKADVLDYLKNAIAITPQARQMALSLVERYREETDPERYHLASWVVARQPYLNAYQYHFALQQAAAACELAPGQCMYLTNLGAAQYRAGDYKQALDSLTKAEQLHAATAAVLALPPTLYAPALTALGQKEELRQTTLANLAFLAMTQHQLGQKEQAAASLARLREVTQRLEMSKNEETHRLLGEVEALLGAKGNGSAK
jgi:WD40 repeat protein/serine/threonine protein kinase